MVKAGLLVVGIIVGGTWACLCFLFAVLLFAMRGLGDEPGRPASIIGALVGSALVVAIGGIGGLLAYWSWLRLKRLRRERGEPTGV